MIHRDLYKRVEALISKGIEIDDARGLLAVFEYAVDRFLLIGENEYVSKLQNVIGVVEAFINKQSKNKVEKYLSVADEEKLKKVDELLKKIEGWVR